MQAPRQLHITGENVSVQLSFCTLNAMPFVGHFVNHDGTSVGEVKPFSNGFKYHTYPREKQMKKLALSQVDTSIFYKSPQDLNTLKSAKSGINSKYNHLGNIFNLLL